ncbi:MAG: PIG-L family deacetylase [Candidatus Eisenbacteria bacterium]|uniref:PIG-L family deacetylase n=1 Tax=Eiseniibacteriota bacterium TaxID=2212470 RepID=A0A956N9H8_UNCEI|nr:PIG-L family deacetylase [Candidatus Eisenbacteria bacterium]
MFYLVSLFHSELNIRELASVLVSGFRPAARTAGRNVAVAVFATLALSAASFGLIQPACSTAHAQPLGPPVDPGRQLELALRNLESSTRILYVTAHPDDEDSGLLARLHYGEGIDVRLLTLTRGEGGQNEIGTELFDALGVLRSRELEGSAEWLGNEQRFSRAFEFGYSFSPEETFALWNEDAILRDIVKEIRDFRPDVILTMQSFGDGGGQHHQASARLAARAREIAATTEWRELGTPHVTEHLYQQLWVDDGGPVDVDVDLGIYDAVLGATYEEFGLRARQSHQCQGMAQLHAPLAEDRSKWREVPAGTTLGGATDASLTGRQQRETRVMFLGSEATDSGQSGDIEGSLPALASRIRAAFARGDDDAGIDELLALYRILDAGSLGETAVDTHSPETSRSSSDADARRDRENLRERVASAIAAAHGLTIHARGDRRYLAAGDSVTFQVRSAGTRPAHLEFLPTAWNIAPHTVDLRPDVPSEVEFALQIPSMAASTLPTPVPRPGQGIDDPVGSFGSPHWSAFFVEPALVLDSTRVELAPLRVLHQEVDPDHPRLVFADMHIVPEPSVRAFTERVPVLGGQATECTWLVSSLHGGKVDVRLELPDGWTANPDHETVDLRPEIEVPVTFLLTSFAPATGRTSDGKGSRNPTAGGEADGERGALTVRASARHLDSGAVSSEGYQRVEYDHVRPTALMTPATAKLVPVDLQVVPGLRIGFVDGSGDQTASAIEALGYEVTRLDESALLQGDLDQFDVIVTGVRAYKVRDDLAAAQPRLMRWVEEGGVLLTQYNKFEFNAGETESSPFAPYPGTLVGRRRVTVEDSPVKVNYPKHPVFHHPNEIGAEDWDGWVQERGLYFLDFADDRYLDLLTLEDPWPYNAGPKGGALVDAKVGKGHWVYIGVGLFRQLPAAVPGAYRLLSNLIALGDH